jgi:transcriptional regulator with XRE-family HTH domain
MAIFGDFIKNERSKKGLNQSEFGQLFGIIMTDISKIENGHKKFPFDALEKLADYLNKEYIEIKNLYVADKLIEEAHKYKCSDDVFLVAEKHSKYIKMKKSKQGKLEL